MNKFSEFLVRAGWVPLLLTMITIVDIIVTGGGICIFLWISYGVYKLALTD